MVPPQFIVTDPFGGGADDHRWLLLYTVVRQVAPRCGPITGRSGSFGTGDGITTTGREPGSSLKTDRDLLDIAQLPQLLEDVPLAPVDPWPQSGILRAPPR